MTAAFLVDAAQTLLLLVDEPRWRRAWARSSVRDRECQPRIPALGPVSGLKLEVGLQTQISLLTGDRENVADLTTDREDSGLECTDPVAGTAIRADLVIGVSNEADKELLRQELRCAPIQVEIDAALVLGGLVLEVIGETRDSRKFMSGCGVEIGVAATAIDGAVPQSEIG